jgi:adenosylhomocysteine nucleosidase
MPVTRLLKGPERAAEHRQAIICVGLALEAEIIMSQFWAEIAGSNCAELSEIARLASGVGCRSIVSFGLAGGLSPELRSGDVVIASGIVGRNGSFATDDAWSGWLLSAIPTARYAPIAGVDSVIAARPKRRELGIRSGALVADMESHIIGQFAAKHQMRFVAVRVVIESIHRKIPRAALACVSASGETRRSTLGRALLGRPAETLDVLRLWADWMTARKALVNCCEILSASICRAEHLGD